MSKYLECGVCWKVHCKSWYLEEEMSKLIKPFLIKQGSNISTLVILNIPLGKW
jgi:hypothetical protein